MNEQPNQTDNAGETPVETQSLEQIAKEIPVEEQAKSFTAQPQPYQPYQQPYQPQQPYIPDPVTDQDGYKRWVAEQVGTTSELKNIVGQLSQKLSSYEEQQAQARIDSEVNDAVAKVNSKLNLDPDLVEASLNVMYKKDPTFKYIWDNRHRNPQAVNKALEVISNNLKGKYSVRQDPQLAENVRAAKSSQQSLATRKPEEGIEVPKDPVAFQQYWSRLVNGG